MPALPPDQRQEPRLAARHWVALGLALGVLVGAGLWLVLGKPLPLPPDGALPAIAPDEAGLAHEWARQRKWMVDRQLAQRDIQSERVLAAMNRVPRHLFVPTEMRHAAYDDRPLPIGHEQTISQPYIVALMTQAADPQPQHRVLEVGTGSGYQTAVLADLTAEVYTIELVPELAAEAQARLHRLGYRNVKARQGDGYLGWPDAAPFDSILVTCGADHVPEPLFDQLKPGGRMVIPVGDSPRGLWLRVITKSHDGSQHSRDLIPVAFVPMRRSATASDK
jgi:protein-L-isoaspartate(D-aspartate) O-methyltransferase